MRQVEILEQLCTNPLHSFKGNSHIKNGEKTCRGCKIFYVLGFTGNYCLQCGKRLATKSVKKYSRYV